MVAGGHGGAGMWTTTGEGRGEQSPRRNLGAGRSGGQCRPWKHSGRESPQVGGLQPWGWGGQKVWCWGAGGERGKRPLRGLGGHWLSREQYLPETTMASFGPQVKNMAQAGAGGGGEKAFADSKGHCGVHRSEPFRFPVSPAPPADNAAQSLPRPRIR